MLDSKLLRILGPIILFLLRPFRDKDVVQDNQVYLRRYALSPKFLAQWLGKWCLHNIRIADQDRLPHDHPTGFTTRILRGGYTEDVYWKGQFFQRYSSQQFEKRSYYDFHCHRLTTVKPNTWTLVYFHPGKPREWGFWSPDGEFIPEKDYLQRG